jgi:hypothetical protein
MLPFDAQILLHHRGVLRDVGCRCGLSAHPRVFLA